MKRFKIRFINEDSLMQSAIKPGNISYDETQEIQQQEVEIPDEQKQENELIANSNQLQPQDVKGMSDGAALGTMLGANQDIQDDTLEALGQKANEFVTKMSTNTITPQDKKDISNDVVASIKTAQKTGFAECIFWDKMENEVLNSLNESLDEYDYSDKGDFVEFAFSLGYEVAERLRQDAGMTPENRNDKVWGLVSDWIEAHVNEVKKLWFKKSPYSGYDPSESDILIVKKQILPDFLEKFGK